MNTLVVVPFVDEPEATIECINGVMSDSVGVCICAISDGSVSSSLKRIINCIRKDHDGLIFIDNVDTKGIASAWNTGLQLFHNRKELEYVCFLHNDTVPKDGWLTELRLAFDVNNNIGAVFSSQGLSSGRYAEMDYDSVLDLPGYCFMLSRDIVERFGRFEMFEVRPELEYFSRMVDEDVRFIEARRSFVEHKGQVTTSKLWTMPEYLERFQKVVDTIKT